MTPGPTRQDKGKGKAGDDLPSPAPSLTINGQPPTRSVTESTNIINSVTSKAVRRVTRSTPRRMSPGLWIGGGGSTSDIAGDASAVPSTSGTAAAPTGSNAAEQELSQFREPAARFADLLERQATRGPRGRGKGRALVDYSSMKSVGAEGAAGSGNVLRPVNPLSVGMDGLDAADPQRPRPAPIGTGSARSVGHGMEPGRRATAKRRKIRHDEDGASTASPTTPSTPVTSQPNQVPSIPSARSNSGLPSPSTSAISQASQSPATPPRPTTDSNAVPRGFTMRKATDMLESHGYTSRHVELAEGGLGWRTEILDQTRNVRWTASAGRKEMSNLRCAILAYGALVSRSLPPSAAAAGNFTHAGPSTIPARRASPPSRPAIPSTAAAPDPLVLAQSQGKSMHDVIEILSSSDREEKQPIVSGRQSSPTRIPPLPIPLIPPPPPVLVRIPARMDATPTENVEIKPKIEPLAPSLSAASSSAHMHGPAEPETKPRIQQSAPPSSVNSNSAILPERAQAAEVEEKKPMVKVEMNVEAVMGQEREVAVAVPVEDGRMDVRPKLEPPEHGRPQALQPQPQLRPQSPALVEQPESPTVNMPSDDDNTFPEDLFDDDPDFADIFDEEEEGVAGVPDDLLRNAMYSTTTTSDNVPIPTPAVERDEKVILPKPEPVERILPVQESGQADSNIGGSNMDVDQVEQEEEDELDDDDASEGSGELQFDPARMEAIFDQIYASSAPAAPQTTVPQLPVSGLDNEGLPPPADDDMTDDNEGEINTAAVQAGTRDILNMFASPGTRQQRMASRTFSSSPSEPEPPVAGPSSQPNAEAGPSSQLRRSARISQPTDRFTPQTPSQSAPARARGTSRGRARGRGRDRGRGRGRGGAARSGSDDGNESEATQYSYDDNEEEFQRALLLSQLPPEADADLGIGNEYARALTQAIAASLAEIKGRMSEAEAMAAAIEASNRENLPAAAGVEVGEVDMEDGEIAEQDAQLQLALAASRAALERRRAINFRPPADGSQSERGEGSRSAM